MHPSQLTTRCGCATKTQPSGGSTQSCPMSPPARTVPPLQPLLHALTPALSTYLQRTRPPPHSLPGPYHISPDTTVPLRPGHAIASHITLAERSWAAKRQWLTAPMVLSGGRSRGTPAAQAGWRVSGGGSSEGLSALVPPKSPCPRYKTSVEPRRGRGARPHGTALWRGCHRVGEDSHREAAPDPAAASASRLRNAKASANSGGRANLYVHLMRRRGQGEGTWAAARRFLSQVKWGPTHCGTLPCHLYP